ncbi:MAG: c-type cytochrome [Verrucomicrobia bacterium]|nr:c-type cytochrome [Verrucomicrobiota bacterium]
MRRAAVAALLRRPVWAMALLDAVEKRELQRGDLGADHWQQLKSHPNRGVSGKAKRLDATAVAATSKDLEALVQKLMPLTTEKGDAARGKQIFETICQVCHTMNAVGGKVGPELTGFGAHPKSEILIAIVDPNRSVEANFRLWTVTTKDGESFAGRLDAETQTSVDILDTTGNKHTVQRKDIAKLEASSLSIMPEGFGNLPPDDLRALLEFISQSNVPKK